MASCIEDAEGRARRNNLRFVGFPEGCEEGNAEQLLTTWLTVWLPPDSIFHCFVIEWAQRALLQKSPPGSRPCPIIAKILNYHDRDNILKQARLKEPLYVNNARILIFPDYTRIVQQQRSVLYGDQGSHSQLTVVICSLASSLPASCLQIPHVVL